MFDSSAFKECHWSEFYPDASEALPRMMPQERGYGVVTSCVVDADHAGCKATRRSHTGTNTVVLKVAEHSRDINIWFGVLRNEDRN